MFAVYLFLWSPAAPRHENTVRSTVKHFMITQTCSTTYLVIHIAFCPLHLFFLFVFPEPLSFCAVGANGVHVRRTELGTQTSVESYTYTDGVYNVAGL